MTSSNHGGITALEMIGASILVVLVVAGALVGPSLVFRPRTTCSAQNACINNLRMIDSAKEQWAMAQTESNGSCVVTSEVNQYLKGATTPSCPQGGTYTYNVIGTDPQCSITNPSHQF